MTARALEPVDDFAERARRWLAANMPPRRSLAGNAAKTPEVEAHAVARARDLQRLLADGGFAGLMFPREYGGQGLTYAHQAAFNGVASPYEIPSLFAVTLGMIVPTLLEVGTEQQRREHVPRMIRGQELWVQLFSEPTGGSDLAGAITRADRDGDSWILNGAKVWTTGAHFSDFGLCLARTNWDVPKHSGLSMFIVALNAPGVAIDPIHQLNGNAEFCQEFFTDVVLGADSLVGQVDAGWNIARTVLVHERNTAGGASTDGGLFGAGRRAAAAFELEKALEGPGGFIKDDVTQAFILHTVEHQLRDRIIAGLRSGELPGAVGSVLKLFGAVAALRRAEIGLNVAGSAGVAWEGEPDDLARTGDEYLMARAMAIGGGTNEIQRNIIGESILGLPRDAAVDRDVPFRSVATNSFVQRTE